MTILCSCVFVTNVSTGQILAKIKNEKNDVHRFCHLQSTCHIASVVFCDLDLLLQCQIFKMSIFQKRWERVQNCYRMTSLRMLYSLTCTYFLQCQNISKINIPKTVRASAKLEEMTFVDFNKCYRMASLWMLYSLALTYFFKVKLQMSISRKQSLLSQKLQEVTF